MRVQSVSVYVSDQERALDFYVTRMGFEKRLDQPMGDDLRWVTVAPSGGETEIILVKGFGGWSEAEVGRGSRIVLWSEDIQSDYQRMTDAGVLFSEPPTPQPWGMAQALFADQDGNGYVMVGPPTR